MVRTRTSCCGRLTLNSKFSIQNFPPPLTWQVGEPVPTSLSLSRDARGNHEITVRRTGALDLPNPRPRPNPNRYHHSLDLRQARQRTGDQTHTTGKCGGGGGGPAPAKHKTMYAHTQQTPSFLISFYAYDADSASYRLVAQVPG